MCFLTFPKTKNTTKFSFVKCFLPEDKNTEKESPPEAYLPMEKKLFHFSKPPCLDNAYCLLVTDYLIRTNLRFSL